jgi:beta-glucosidase
MATLNADYCTRLTFNYTPRTSGNHLLSVLATGTATLYIDVKEAFHRLQEQLQREAFYFYQSKFERRFHFEMEDNKTYSIRLESRATEPDALARTIGGAVVQGSGVRFFEIVDVLTQIQRAADAAAKVEIALVFTGTTNKFESEGYDRETMDLTADQYKADIRRQC